MGGFSRLLGIRLNGIDAIGKRLLARAEVVIGNQVHAVNANQSLIDLGQPC